MIPRSRIVHAVDPAPLYLYGVNSKNQTVAVPGGSVALSVTGFGAKGDGVTDDTAAIQAALNTGLNVFIPPGTYITNRPLSVTAAGQLVEGAGKDTHITCTGTNNFAAVLEVNSTSSVTVRNMSLTPGTVSASYLQGFGLITNSSSKITLEQLWVTGHRRGGICLQDSNDCSVRGCFISDSVVSLPSDDHKQSGTAIYVTGNSSRNRISDNSINGDCGVGISVQLVNSGETARGNIITNNTIANCIAYGIMLYVVDSTTSDIFDTVIANNSIHNTTGALADATYGNTYGASIYIQGAEYTSVTGNTIKTSNVNTAVELLAPGAIGITNCSEILVSDNVIDDARWYSIAVFDPNGLGINKTGVIVSNNKITNSAKSGIYFKDFVKGVVSGNTLDSITQHGIWVRNVGTTISDAFAVTGNIITNATGSGILVEAGDSVITGNLVKLCATVGIVVGAVGGARKHAVSNNVILSCTVRGFQANSGDVSFSGNLLSGNGYNINAGTPIFGLERNIIQYPITGNFQGTFANLTICRTFTSGDATPSVKHGHQFIVDGTTTITDFDDGQDGQIITVHTGASPIQIAHSGAILLNGAVNVTLGGTIRNITLIRRGGGWQEIARF